MKTNTYKYQETTKNIIGCAMHVHSFLGNGFQEVIYQRSLTVEMGIQGLDFEREVEMPIFYKDVEVGTRRADILVDNKILVELKALINLEEVHLAQALNYLEAYNLEIGLLINFGARSLQFKRLLNKKFKNPGNPVIKPNPGSDIEGMKTNGVRKGNEIVNITESRK